MDLLSSLLLSVKFSIASSSTFTLELSPHWTLLPLSSVSLQLPGMLSAAQVDPVGWRHHHPSHSSPVQWARMACSCSDWMPQETHETSTVEVSYGNDPSVTGTERHAWPNLKNEAKYILHLVIKMKKIGAEKERERERERERVDKS